MMLDVNKQRSPSGIWWRVILAALPALIVLAGIALRLQHFFENRSLWMDEAWVGLYVSALSFKQILANVRFAFDIPVPPMGFLLAEKSAVAFLGNNEMALRLYPLICSVTGLVCFVPVVRKIFKDRWTLLALALLVLADPLIYYASEAKQYAGDVLAAVLLYWLVLALDHKPLGRRERLSLMAAGVAGMIFSHGTLFILCGVGLYLLGARLGKEKQAAIHCARIFAVWSLSFCYWYLVSFRGMLANAAIEKGASRFFVPWPLGSSHAWFWTADAFVALFHETAGFVAAWPAVILFFVGCGVLIRRSPARFWLFVGPLGAGLLTAMAHVYNFSGRFELFALPGVFITITEGARGLARASGGARRVAAAGLAAVLMASVGAEPLVHAITGRAREEMRPVIRFVKQHARKTDGIFVNASGEYAYSYYLLYGRASRLSRTMGLFSDNVLTRKGRPYLKITSRTFYHGLRRSEVWIDSPVLAVRDLNEAVLPGRRVWVVFAHEGNSRSYVLSGLARERTLLAEDRAVGAAAYLFGPVRKHPERRVVPPGLR